MPSWGARPEYGGGRGHRVWWAGSGYYFLMHDIGRGKGGGESGRGVERREERGRGEGHYGSLNTFFPLNK